MDIDKLEELIRQRKAIDQQIREIATAEPRKRMGRPPKNQGEPALQDRAPGV